MGNWQLEIFKMALYMAFPVGCFHYFNQPAYFEKWVVETKKEIYPVIREDERLAFEEVKARLQEEQEQRAMKAYEEQLAAKRRS